MAATYEGWKGIAAGLGKSVRTVQGWARRYKLPVEMLCGSVFLDTDKYEAWRKKQVTTYLEALESRKSSPELSDGSPEAQERAAETPKAA